MRLLIAAAMVAALPPSAYAQQWGPQFGYTPNSAWSQPAPPPEQFHQIYNQSQQYDYQRDNPYQGFGAPSINPQSQAPHNSWNR